MDEKVGGYSRYFHKPPNSEDIRTKETKNDIFRKKKDLLY